MITLTLRVPEDILEDLNAVCKEQERSKSWFIKKALQEKLEDWKDYKIGIKALDEHYKNGNITHSLESVAKEFGIEIKNNSKTKAKKLNRK